MKINTFLQFVIILPALNCVAVYAVHYTINFESSQNHVNLTRIYTEDTYCISMVPDVIGLDKGKAAIPLYTNSYAFNSCGYVHSSANFYVVDNTGKRWIQFQFYKPASMPGQLYLVDPEPEYYCEVNGFTLSCPEF